MLEMVEARRTSHEVGERHDLFSGLLDASQEEMNDGAALNDDELIGKQSNVAPLIVIGIHMCPVFQEICSFLILLDMR